MLIHKYRKLENLDLTFDNHVNLIAGTNGTCKSSILYLISNSYKPVTMNSQHAEVAKCLKTIKDINKVSNPKIEGLTRGDKSYNDPAPGVEGALLKTNYINNKSLNFRKHNSKSEEKFRFAVKPEYKRGASENLPELPVLYLGLSRLATYGEFESDELIKELNNTLPEYYQNEIARIYEEFTNVKISNPNFNDMGGLKTRGDFKSNEEGIDSNTISAGEDNLYIIIAALISLRYYAETKHETNTIGELGNGILTIDELDATLHPSYQFKLFDFITEYANEYNFQVFFTSHSLSLIEYALNSKSKVFYFADQINKVEVATNDEELDIMTINNHLRQKTAIQDSLSRKIPVFTEDDEARSFLEATFDKFSNDENSDFKKVRHHFHFVKSKIGAGNLTSIFKDRVVVQELVKAICILDGDQNGNMHNNIIILPGNKNPEELLFQYLKEMVEDSSGKYDEFWSFNKNWLVKDLGYSKTVVRDQIVNEYIRINEEKASKQEEGITTKGFSREEYKELFEDHSSYLFYVFQAWLNDPDNQKEVIRFYENLYSMFKKTAMAHNVNKNLWLK